MTKTVRARLQYMVGGLLYSPAINVGLAEKIDNGCFPCLTSMAFCLEDSIRDEALEEAEAELCSRDECLFRCKACDRNRQWKGRRRKVDGDRITGK